MNKTDLRIKFTKCENSKYISHLDLMRLFQRAFRRAGLHLKHTEGFNPQPKLAFATALSLGTSSEGEYLDLELEEEVELIEFKDKINSVLPSGVEVIDAEYKRDKDSIASLIRYGFYEIELTLTEQLRETELEEKLLDFLKRDEIIVLKEKKKKGRIVTNETNIRDLIKQLQVEEIRDNKVVLKALLVTGSSGNLKPELLLEALEKYEELALDKRETKIHRINLFIEQDKKIVSPLEKCL